MTAHFELPLEIVLQLAKFTENRVVDIETRPEHVTSEKVMHILRLLKPKVLQVRIGFEIWKEEIRNSILRKGIPQSEVYRVAKIKDELQILMSLQMKIKNGYLMSR